MTNACNETRRRKIRPPSTRPSRRPEARASRRFSTCGGRQHGQIKIQQRKGAKLPHSAPQPHAGAIRALESAPANGPRHGHLGTSLAVSSPLVQWTQALMLGNALVLGKSLNPHTSRKTVLLTRVQLYNQQYDDCQGIFDITRCFRTTANSAKPDVRNICLTLITHNFPPPKNLMAKLPFIFNGPSLKALQPQKA